MEAPDSGGVRLHHAPGCFLTTCRDPRGQKMKPEGNPGTANRDLHETLETAQLAARPFGSSTFSQISFHRCNMVGVGVELPSVGGVVV